MAHITIIKNQVPGLKVPGVTYHKHVAFDDVVEQQRFVDRVQMAKDWLKSTDPASIVDRSTQRVYIDNQLYPLVVEYITQVIGRIKKLPDTIEALPDSIPDDVYLAIISAHDLMVFFNAMIGKMISQPPSIRR